MANTQRQELNRLRAMDANPRAELNRLRALNSMRSSNTQSSFQEPTVMQGLGQALGSITDPAAQVIQQGALAIPAGLSGISALIGGQGVNEAVDQIRRIQDFAIPSGTEAGRNTITSLGQSAPVHALQRGTEFIGNTLEQGGLFPPGVGGAIGETIPTAIGLAAGSRLDSLKPKSTIVDLNIKAKAKPNPTPILDKSGNTIGLKALPAPKTPGKKLALAKEIKAGSTDVSTAKFRLNKTGTGVIPDKVAKAAIRQGFRAGAVADIKAASTATKTKLREMVDTLERIRKSAVAEIRTRPSDVLGDAVGERLNVIRAAKKDAADKLDTVAESLKGQHVDVSDPFANFQKALEKMGVTIDENLIPHFSKSAIEGVGPPKSAINAVMKRIKSFNGNTDAHNIHLFKGFLDERLNFGKTPKGGLAGKTEFILKTLRRELDQRLDATFPIYDKVNSIFAETKTILDEAQKAAGTKIDLQGPGANSAIGTLARRITSSAQSRVQIRNLLDQISKVAEKNGGKFNDNLDTLTIFANELDNVFGPVAQNSFSGQIVQAGKQLVTSPKEGIARLAGEGIKKVLRVSDEKAFTAIKDLLK